MTSVNSVLQEESIRHALQLQGYSNQIVRKIMAVLGRSDERLTAELALALERLDRASFTVERMESLLYGVRSVNAEAYKLMGVELTEQLRSFVQYEAAYQAQSLQAVLPAVVRVAAIDVGMTYAAAMARPFQGVLLKGVLDDLADGKAKKIRQAIAQGFTEGKTTSQIVRELRGTKARGYEDGLLARDRRDIEAVARTALGHMAGFTQDRFVEANTDIIKAVKWLSTIDLRVSKICLIRDGKQYTPDTHKPIGHSIPWLSGPGRAHWRCRSHQTYVLRSHSEMNIDVPEIVMANGSRASLDGQIGSDIKLPEWAKNQSAARQDALFGPARGRLLREGGLDVPDLYSSKGVFLDLETLRKQDVEAFKRAGL